MKKITLLFVALACTVFVANAQFSFPAAGPINVAANAVPPAMISINDADNSAGVPSGQYADFVVTVDWAAGSGGPWSTEARLTLTTAAGDVPLDFPAGGASNSNPTTLTFTGGLLGIYDPDVDGTLMLTLDQVFSGSDADWSNIVVTINPFTSPTLPTTDATFNISGCEDVDTTTFAYDVGTQSVYWLEIVYDGASCDLLTFDTLTSDFDTELGLYDSDGFLVANNDDVGGGPVQSLIDLTGSLSAGTYYLAASAFNTTFGGGFAVTTSATITTGSLVLTSTTGDTLSLDEVVNSNALKYYPNPVNNVLNLDARQIVESISVFNIAGQRVLESTPNVQNAKLDMSKLQTGAYFVRVQITNGSKTIKVMKQ